MGFVSSLYNTERPTSVIFKTRDTPTSTKGQKDPSTYTTVKTVDCLYWIGVAAERLVSEKLKAVIDGVIVLDYSTTIAALNKVDIAIIDGVNYSFLSKPDNIANQNQVLQIPVRKF